MPALGPALRPNQWVSQRTYLTMAAAWAVAVFLLWMLTATGIFPNPARVGEALRTLTAQQGLIGELLTSLTLFGESLLIAAVLSMALAYLSVVPALRPVIQGLTRARFLSLVGLTFLFTMTFGGGHPLKVSLLVFGISAFFLTSMVDIVASVPTERLDHARTLRMSDWRVVWEVVILGTADRAFEVLRQNAAIGWMMLTMVEGISRSEGGVGAMLLNQSKHFHLAEVFAIQLVILLVGLLQDYGIGVFRRLACPYADLTLERAG
jgi:NitT/TauT family transport system permease protein